jgi:hypothetical protein
VLYNQGVEDMRRSFALLAALLTLALGSTGRSADDNKKTDAKLPGDQKEAYDKMVSTGQLTGKLTHWGEGSQKYMTVQVTVKYGVPNVDAARNIANLQKQAAEASRDPNPVNRANRLNNIQYELLKNQKVLITVKEESKNVELQASDDMKVRVKELPPVFDEKGKVKKLSPKELKERKGDTKLPGYTAELSDLKSNQTVTVYLAKKKDTKPAKDKNKDEAALENRPQVTMIVIEAEPPAPK